MSEDESHGIPAPEGAADIIQTDYNVGDDNIKSKVGPFRIDIHNPVFAVSAGLIILFVIITLLMCDSDGEQFGAMQSWVYTTFDWFLLSSANIFLLVCLG